MKIARYFGDITIIAETEDDPECRATITLTAIPSGRTAKGIADCLIKQDNRMFAFIESDIGLYPGFPIMEPFEISLGTPVTPR